MACDTPLIVTSPGGRDFIEDFLSEWVLCEPSLDAVARGMHRLLEADDETRESLAAQGVAMVRSKYTVTKLIDLVLTTMWDHKAARWNSDAIACGDGS